ncbi:cytochrome c biogenesis FC, mitochondrion [Artemisia annua]|uniref:Cytochrome c biogenesis FC, mitochondrion n=1 Tax=Artemisia annua TaxID=35608 RepID=A0A2U1M6Q7_ARTAN|nr:cytochrome c biogenesis FC, mitochondrion [Artemisia annua]
MVVPRGTAAPVLLKWFVSRDVPTGAPSSNELVEEGSDDRFIPLSVIPLANERTTLLGL